MGREGRGTPKRSGRIDARVSSSARGAGQRQKKEERRFVFGQVAFSKTRDGSSPRRRESTRFASIPFDATAREPRSCLELAPLPLPPPASRSVGARRSIPAPSAVRARLVRLALARRESRVSEPPTRPLDDAVRVEAQAVPEAAPSTPPPAPRARARARDRHARDARTAPSRATPRTATSPTPRARASSSSRRASIASARSSAPLETTTTIPPSSASPPSPPERRRAPRRRRNPSSPTARTLARRTTTRVAAPSSSAPPRRSRASRIRPRGDFSRAARRGSTRREFSFSSPACVVWDAATHTRPVASLRGHRRAIDQVAFASERVVVTLGGARDGHACAWDFAAGAPLAREPVASAEAGKPARSICCLASANDPFAAFVVAAEGDVSCWTRTSGPASETRREGTAKALGVAPRRRSESRRSESRRSESRRSESRLRKSRDRAAAKQGALADGRADEPWARRRGSGVAVRAIARRARGPRRVRVGRRRGGGVRRRDGGRSRRVRVILRGSALRVASRRRSGGGAPRRETDAEEALGGFVHGPRVPRRDRRDGGSLGGRSRRVGFGARRVGVARRRRGRRRRRRASSRRRRFGTRARCDLAIASPHSPVTALAIDRALRSTVAFAFADGTIGVWALEAAEAATSEAGPGRERARGGRRRASRRSRRGGSSPARARARGRRPIDRRGSVREPGFRRRGFARFGARFALRDRRRRRRREDVGRGTRGVAGRGGTKREGGGGGWKPTRRRGGFGRAPLPGRVRFHARRGASRRPRARRRRRARARANLRPGDARGAPGSRRARRRGDRAGVRRRRRRRRDDDAGVRGGGRRRARVRREPPRADERRRSGERRTRSRQKQKQKPAPGSHPHMQRVVNANPPDERARTAGSARRSGAVAFAAFAGSRLALFAATARATACARPLRRARASTFARCDEGLASSPTRRSSRRGVRLADVSVSGGGGFRSGEEGSGRGRGRRRVASSRSRSAPTGASAAARPLSSPAAARARGANPNRASASPPSARRIVRLRLTPPSAGAASAFALAPSGGACAVSSADGGVRTFDPATGACVRGRVRARRRGRARGRGSRDGVRRRRRERRERRRDVPRHRGRRRVRLRVANAEEGGWSEDEASRSVSEASSPQMAPLRGRRRARPRSRRSTSSLLLFGRRGRRSGRRRAARRRSRLGGERNSARRSRCFAAREASRREGTTRRANARGRTRGTTRSSGATTRRAHPAAPGSRDVRGGGGR